MPLVDDIRYAWRTFAKTPGFTVLALAALALGIGANTAIFSVIHAVLFNPTPYTDPDRAVIVWETAPKVGMNRFSASGPDYLDWRARNRSFEHLAAITNGEANLTGMGEPERLRGAFVTPNLFPALRVRPALGRTFTEEEGARESRVAVLSHGLWQRRFGGDPGAVGRQLTIDGVSHTVIGVMAQGFDLPAVDLWRPLVFPPEVWNTRGSHMYVVLGRLRDGVSLAQARADLGSIARQIAEAHPDRNRDYGVELVTLRDESVRDIRPALYLLSAAVALILLIACANVANLLLTRALGRRREIAVRSALGASRVRILRQLVTESLLLAMSAGAAGVFAALWGVQLIVRLVPPEQLSNPAGIGVDMAVIAFACALSIVTGVALGLAPVLGASRISLASDLKEGGRMGTAGSRRQRLRAAFAVGEVALAVVLLVGAGLLVRSFRKLLATPSGVRPEGLVTMEIALPEARYAEPERRALAFRQIVAAAESVPGVASAAFVSVLPLQGHVFYNSFDILGRPPAASLGDKPKGDKRHVTAGYFRTTGIPVLKGRGFTRDDNETSEGVAIVDQSAAARYWPNGDAVGQQIQYFDREGRPWRRCTIVGVAGNVVHERLENGPSPTVYVPIAQEPVHDAALVVATPRDPASIVPDLRTAVAGVDRDLPLARIQTMQALVSRAVWRPRLAAELVALLAGLALVLAVTGVYAVIAYGVAQRTQEIGIRLALGATSERVLGLVLREGAAVAAAGIGCGFAAAYALARAMRAMLYGVAAGDPLSFAAAAAIIGAAALGATYISAARAARIDPIVALRQE